MERLAGGGHEVVERAGLREDVGVLSADDCHLLVAGLVFALESVDRLVFALEPFRADREQWGLELKMSHRPAANADGMSPRVNVSVRGSVFSSA